MSGYIYKQPDDRGNWVVKSEPLLHLLTVKRELPAWLLSEDFKSCFGLHGKSVNIGVIVEIASKVDIDARLRQYRLDKSNVPTPEPDIIEKPISRWSRYDD